MFLDTPKDPTPKTGDMCCIVTMRVISRKKLVEFWQKYPDSEQPVRAWFAEAKNANWTTPADVKALYRNASIIPGNRVVFNIKGNTYQLVVLVDYKYGKMFVRFIGTHAEYERINAARI